MRVSYSRQHEKWGLSDVNYMINRHASITPRMKQKLHSQNLLVETEKSKKIKENDFSILFCVDRCTKNFILIINERQKKKQTQI